jgi:predicted dehydrogenase
VGAAVHGEHRRARPPRLPALGAHPVRRGGQPGSRDGEPVRRRARRRAEPGGAHRAPRVDPDGAYGLRHDDTDVYRIELDAVSAAIAGRGPLPFGRADAVAQARALEALLAAAATGAPVSVPA